MYVHTCVYKDLFGQTHITLSFTYSTLYHTLKGMHPPKVTHTNALISCMYTLACTCVYMRKYIHTHTYAYLNIDIYIYIDVHIHTYNSYMICVYVVCKIRSGICIHPICLPRRHQGT